MHINSYPTLLISCGELVYIEDQEQLESETYHIDSNDLAKAMVISKEGYYFSLNGERCMALTLPELSHLVQQALLLEGHCCVEKIQLSHPSDAFALFAVDQSAQMCSNTATKG